MKVTIIYPADFFDRKKVDPDYEHEYKEVIRFPEFQVVFYNYDGFAAGDKLKLYPADHGHGLCVYRGWMLSPDRYRAFYYALKENGLCLINTPEQYENCHEFPNAYPLLSDFTPKMLSYCEEEQIDWENVKKTFTRFLMKDYVKSVKGTEFPKYFMNTLTDEEMNTYVSRFKEMRGDLFVKGIVLKEYVDLKQYNDITNEYRAFYLNGRPLSLSKNSNQNNNAIVPDDFIKKMPKLTSNFYTIDFAELENGEWIVIETGDGQVSGLSPGQYVFKYYEEMLNILQEGRSL